MQTQSTPASLTPRNGVLALSGYGIRVAVERGHLAVSDGIGDDRRGGRFSKVARDIKRVVVIGHTGTISLEALRWLRDIGASFSQIDADGNVILASGPAGLDDARLRRAQAVAVFDDTGIAIARDLIGEKLAGQLAVLGRFLACDAAMAIIQRTMDALGDARTPDEIMLLESEAARVYWRAWEAVPLRFGKQDIPRVPAHWCTFGPRGSLVANGPRNATNPANAILNYLYAILEAEARIAALTMGLDPGMGVLHADQRGRDSLACDLMEAVRPQVDAFVLEMLGKRTFRAGDFFENRQGVCRVLPPLTKMLAETAPRWARAIGPVAERFARMLATGDAPTPGLARKGGRPRGTGATITRIATPLTQANRSAGRDGIRRSAKSETGGSQVGVPSACAGCGEVLEDQRRRYCDACLPEHESEKLAALIAKGPATLARMRAEGRDPSKTPEALQKQSERMIAQRRAAHEWELEHPERSDPDVFKREILPKLQYVSTNALMKATGLSKSYCAAIRKGAKIPHYRHWSCFPLGGVDAMYQDRPDKHKT